jgi:hypothetical protein
LENERRKPAELEKARMAANCCRESLLLLSFLLFSADRPTIACECDIEKFAFALELRNAGEWGIYGRRRPATALARDLCGIGEGNKGKWKMELAPRAAGGQPTMADGGRRRRESANREKYERGKRREGKGHDSGQKRDCLLVLLWTYWLGEEITCLTGQMRAPTSNKNERLWALRSREHSALASVEMAAADD